MSAVREVVKRVVPEDALNWYRRRRARRQYLDALSRELLKRETSLDHIEGRMAAKRDGFYERIVRDVVERTEIIVQELDRRLEGMQARTGERFEGIEEQLRQLRAQLDRLTDLGATRGTNGEDRDQVRPRASSALPE